MKRNLFTFICTIFTCALFAQNPAIVNPGLAPNPPVEGGSGVATFTATSTSGDVLPASGLTITISFTGAAPMAPTGPTAALFSWSLIDMTYQGTLIATLPEAGGGVISFPFTVTGMENATIGFNANLGNVPTVANGNVTNDDQTFLFTQIAQNPLPVELIAFSGKAENCEFINLNWATAQEHLNKGFEIQKMDQNNRFETVAFVEGVGEANFVNSYQYQVRLEANELGKQLIFRLKQLDYNGAFDYSDAISVGNVCMKEIDFEIFPNPAIDQVNVVLMADFKGTHKVELFNEFQQFVKEFEINVNEAHSLAIGDLSPGVYFFRIAHNNEHIIKRIVKVKK